MIKLKQLSTRLSTFSGAFNMLFTAGWAFVDKNTLYDSMVGITTATTCKNVGFYIARTIANLLEAFTADNVYYDQVSKTPNAVA